MHVWIVEGSYYDEEEDVYTRRWIVGVYSSLERANQVREEMYANPRYDNEGYAFPIWERVLDGKPEN